MDRGASASVVHAGGPAAARSASDSTRPLGEVLHAGCVACGSANGRGLNLRFTRVDGGVTAEFACDASYEGYRDVIHGGIVCTLLDAAMTHCLFAAGRSGRTGRLSVRFRHPVAARGSAQVSAAIVRLRGRVASMTARLTQDGEVKATASAAFVLDEGVAGGDRSDVLTPGLGEPRRPGAAARAGAVRVWPLAPAARP
jgi:acyl-coenzyme A thioesterase PaaI-like protein